jgi:mannose-6-phosphate isomerase-like protein (cupin superfamily)
MARGFDLSTTFVHLADGGGAEPLEPTPSFWRGSAGKRYDRVVGAFDFSSSEDLHASMQEMHPAADEVLFLASGALDVIVEDAGGERTIPLEAGQAAIVPRGAWHRLVMRRPGRLVFINSRTGIQGRPCEAREKTRPR